MWCGLLAVSFAGEPPRGFKPMRFNPMPRFSALLVALALVVSSMSLCNVSAAADESPAVEALIQRGIQLRRTGDDEAALAVFMQAESEAPNSVRVMLHVVTAAQAAGKWLMADEYMRRVSRDKDDAYYRRHRVSIEQVEAAIAQRVGQFQALGAPEGAEIRLNGESFGKLPMAQPRSLETGTYVMEVVSPGHYNLRRPISVTGGVLTRESVELKVRPADAPVDFTAAGAAGARREEPPKEWWQSSAVTWSLAGVSILGVATTTAAYIVREQQAEKWNDESQCIAPDQTRSQACADIRDDIDTAETFMVVGGVTAVAFGGAAIAHWVATSGSSSSDGTEGTTRGTPRRAGLDCAPGVMAIVCKGSF
jgi:PEGA domain-containing protein